MSITIDTRSLANILNSLRSSTIISIHARTVPVMRKTGNPWYGRVVKLARLTAVIGASYESSVNRRREKEAAQAGRKSIDYFHADKRTWGKREIRKPRRRQTKRDRQTAPLIQYKGRFYLNLQRQKMLHCEYRDTDTGAEIPAAEIEPWIRPRNEGKRQQLNNPVINRDYTLTNILQLRMQGKVYEIRQPEVRSQESGVSKKKAA